MIWVTPKIERLSEVAVSQGGILVGFSESMTVMTMGGGTLRGYS